MQDRYNQRLKELCWRYGSQKVKSILDKMSKALKCSVTELLDQNDDFWDGYSWGYDLFEKDNSQNVNVTTNKIIKADQTIQENQNQIPMLSGRPDRDFLIDYDDLLNLKIALETEDTINAFLEKM